MVVSPPSYPTPTSPTAHPALLGREGVDLVLSSNGVHERSMEQDGKNTVKEEVKPEQEEDAKRRSREVTQTTTSSPSTLKEKPTDLQLSSPKKELGVTYSDASFSTLPPFHSQVEEVLKPHLTSTSQSPSSPDYSKPFPPSSSTSSSRPHLPREASSSTQHQHQHQHQLALSRSGSPTASTSTSTSKSRSEGSNTPMVDDVLKVVKKKRVKKEKEVVVAQLIGHLPRAEEEAGRTYQVLESCTYASKALGNFAFPDDDSMQCDCTYSHDVENPDQACGEDAQCMNRLMQIECVEGDCKCRKHCQNQRFQKRQYADIEVVKTENKGFGVRINQDLPADTFVYEYVGEVIGPTVFKKKMKEYASEGIRHFYFMALDKEVYIDATKRGGKGRFLNHSCNPNCVVAKWTVGNKMRMGIFTKRNVKKDEELTFNYNVDRYGHEAQKCYCDEPSCVGFIGGKTQTDIGGMDDLYLDALGIAEEVEALGLRGTKKKKGKHIDDDFIPLLKSVEMDEVPKVSAAIRQAITTRRILEKLLIRIQMTLDNEVLRQIQRLHGFNLMNHILKEHKGDAPVVTLALEILVKWPLKTRNKIETSNIEPTVKICLEMVDVKVQELAHFLLDEWTALELGYRIPKALRDAGEEIDRKRRIENNLDQIVKRARLDPEADVLDSPSRPTFIKPEASLVLRTVIPKPPTGWLAHKDSKSTQYYYENSVTHAVQWEFPTAPVVEPSTPKVKGLDVNAILAQAQAEADAVVRKEKERQAEEDAKARAAKRESGKLKSKKRSSGSEGTKEKRVMTLFSAIVIGVMSKYKAHLEQDQFKKRAREVTQLLCDKEAKHPLYASETYSVLSPDKTAKIQSFTKGWIKKLIERKRSSSSTSTPLRHSTNSTANSTPHPHLPSPSNTNTPSSMQDDADFLASMVAEVQRDQDAEAEAKADEEEEDMQMDDDEGTPPGSPTRDAGETA